MVCPHLSGHPSATGRAQDRESSPAKDRRYTAVPHNQPEPDAVNTASPVALKGVNEVRRTVGVDSGDGGAFPRGLPRRRRPAHVATRSSRARVLVRGWPV